jgi:hypothetical protein
MDKDDCMSEAMLDILKYWKRFDSTIPNSNVFSYFTQIGKNGLAKGWKKIKNVKSMDVVSISQDSGIYNI